MSSAYPAIYRCSDPALLFSLVVEDDGFCPAQLIIRFPSKLVSFRLVEES
jgi:hypothetical protein